MHPGEMSPPGGYMRMKKPGYQVCLLLGSNIRPEYNLPLAVAILRQELTILQVSSVWESTAVGGNSPNFLNAALLAISYWDAFTLKQRILLPLESRLGRVRSADKYAPRPIDLDIIFFNHKLLDPTLWDYVHRAVPVAEILPETLSEQGKPLSDVAASLASAAPIHLRADVLL
jgi:2-amino-4-hydroxy-6-hydroxymethyldihydropteridine diphosphokinase